MILPCCRSIPGWQGMEKIPFPQRRRTVSWWPWPMRTLTTWSNMCQSWTLWSVSREHRKSLSSHQLPVSISSWCTMEHKAPLKISYLPYPLVVQWHILKTPYFKSYKIFRLNHIVYDCKNNNHELQIFVMISYSSEMSEKYQDLKS